MGSIIMGVVLLGLVLFGLIVGVVIISYFRLWLRAWLSQASVIPTAWSAALYVSVTLSSSACQ